MSGFQYDVRFLLFPLFLHILTPTGFFCPNRFMKFKNKAQPLVSFVFEAIFDSTHAATVFNKLDLTEGVSNHISLIGILLLAC